MTRSRIQVRIAWIAILPGLVLIISISLAYRVTPTFAQNGPKVFLPFVNNDFPHNEVFGATVENSPAGGLDLMDDAGISWVRYTVPWATIQPLEEGMAPDWSVMQPVEAQIRSALQKDIQVILTLDKTPDWALKEGSCGPVTQDKFEKLEAFVRDMVQRYRSSEFQVKYWELWNEPDTVEDSLGCWGDPNDPLYGGGYYSLMLNEIYPVIKSEEPNAQVLVGGLLLDCDPNNPPETGSGILKDCTPAKFLEGILAQGNGNNFDGISFHAYDYWGSNNEYKNPNWNSSWNTTGPVQIAKVNYLQSLLSKYGVTGKFLINTEVALICGSSGGETECQTDAYEDTKSYYIAQSNAAAMALDLRGNLWYSTFGWRNSQLLNPNLTLRPAYHAFQTGFQQLRGTKYEGPVQAAGVQGYRFTSNEKKVWVVWSLDDADHSLSLPKTPIAVYDVFGTQIGNTNITKMPIYIVFAP